MYLSNLLIFESLEKFLSQASADPSAYVLESGAFRFAHILSFRRVALLILGLLKRSLTVELYHFFDQLGSASSVCTKSAFCQARKKLSSQFFVAWNDHLLSLFYSPSNSKGVRRWKGYRLCAIDGSELQLMEHQQLRAHFGQRKHRKGATTMARLVCCYDVLNHLCLWAKLSPLSEQERQIVISTFDRLESDMLMIYDRLYPSFEFFFVHHQAEQAFLMRMRKSFKIVTAFLESGLQEQICYYTPLYNAVNPLKGKGYPIDKETQIPIRLLRIELPKGEIEVLATSLLDRELFPHKEFKALYFQRWKIETFFDFLKNNMAIESFSGYSPLVIQQDVAAHIFLANIHQLILAQEPTGKPKRKINKTHQYKPNANVILGILVHKYLQLFTPRTLEKTLIFLRNAAQNYTEPIRRNRSSPRRKNALSYRNKYRMIYNFKRAL